MKSNTQYSNGVQCLDILNLKYKIVQNNKIIIYDDYKPTKESIQLITQPLLI